MVHVEPCLLRRLYISAHVFLTGYFPTGTLVRVTPSSYDAGIFWRSDLPEAGSVCIVVGRWSQLLVPGMRGVGSVVLHGGRCFDVESWDLEAINETG